MSEALALLKASPSSVKNALVFLVAGWILHFVFLFRIFGGEVPTRMLWQQVAIAVVICVFVAKIKKWARILCLVGNALIIILYSSFAYLFYMNYMKNVDTTTGSLSLMAIFMFGLSTYYLLHKKTAEYYKAHAKAPLKEEDSAEEAQE